VPLPAVDDHVVANTDAVDVLADRIDDAGSVAAPDVKVVRLAELGVGPGDVHRYAPSRPHVVVVDPCCHDQDQRIGGSKARDLDLLDLERVLRLAVALRSNDLSEHPGRHLAQRGDLADVVELLGHGPPSAGRQGTDARDTDALPARTEHNLPAGRYLKRSVAAGLGRGAATGSPGGRRSQFTDT